MNNDISIMARAFVWWLDYLPVKDVEDATEEPQDSAHIMTTTRTTNGPSEKKNKWVLIETLRNRDQKGFCDIIFGCTFLQEPRQEKYDTLYAQNVELLARIKVMQDEYEAAKKILDEAVEGQRKCEQDIV